MNDAELALETAIRQQDLANQKHYTSGDIEPIEYIAAQGLLPEYAVGNVIKYVTRYKHKNGIEDLKKARVYLDFLIRHMEGKPVVEKQRYSRVPAKIFNAFMEQK